MSGYGGYNWNFNAFSRNKWEHTDSKIILDYNNKPSQNSNIFEHAYTPSSNIKGTQIKVSGIKNGSRFNLYNQLNTADSGAIEVNNILIKSDGIYSIPDIILSDESNISTSYYGFNNINIEEGDIITIEQIPLYPNALVLDGIDDYIALEAFDSGFKTIFMVCNPFTLGKILYDQRSNLWKNYALQNIGGAIAYSSVNENGTYINNVFNTKITTNELINKKHLISIITNDISASRQPNIGRSIGNNLYANMAIYKFLGFKDELTEEQIQAIIKKYNLLYGVDEIEVS